ncbi:MAG: tRNA lysidine(34) synthetase TilS [FCB group bacterium]|nr:tRNA lysidine(34) synthetase TilS [FCB group bacterium]
MSSGVTGLKKQFIAHPAVSRLLQPGRHVLVAVSGGRDSLCLLHLLAGLKEEWQLRLTAAHVNHGLRTNADNDQYFVAEICKEWNIPFVVRKLNPRTKSPGESIEAWARKERYLALEEMRQETGADLIATAHHGNDQVETILLRLGAGAGIKGLRGIHPKRGRIIRPLLPFPGSVIETYVKAHEIPYREDETNKDIHYPRNYLRHRVIPEWEKLNPGLVAAFHQVCENIRETEPILEYAVEHALRTVVTRESDGRFLLAVRELAKLPVLLQVMIISRLLGGDALSRRHLITQLKTFLKSAKVGSWLPFPAGWLLLKDRENWILNQPGSCVKKEIPVVFGKSIDCGDFVFNWNDVDSVKDLGTNPWKEIIDGQVIKDEKLILRNWCAGDYFQPLGMQGHKKISDFLTDIKMDRFNKQRQLVLASKNEIIWLCGQRISERVKVTPQTRRFEELSIVPKVG